MATLPEREYSTVAFIDRMHEERRDLSRPRSYMQVSLLGHPCDRFLWLTFRWAVIEPFPGRILRLFRRGQLEEDTAAQDLRDIGVVLEHTGANQLTLKAGKWVMGHPDGIIRKGLPEAPLTEHLWECKTFSLKRFEELLSSGSVRVTKPMHWTQMQVYMLLKGLKRALYYGVCKNDDRIYTERIEIDYNEARRAIGRGQRLALEERLPPPLSTNPEWWQCMFCPAHSFCHSTHKIKEVNCRTCAHSTPLENETWHCTRWTSPVPEYAQYDGCECHVIHPDLVPWRIDPHHTTDFEAAFIIDGKVVMNGEHGYPSDELLNTDGPWNDAVIDMVKAMFKGRVVANA